jgi:hypothetical protein
MTTVEANGVTLGVGQLGDAALLDDTHPPPPSKRQVRGPAEFGASLCLEAAIGRPPEARRRTAGSSRAGR